MDSALGFAMKSNILEILITFCVHQHQPIIVHDLKYKYELFNNIASKNACGTSLLGTEVGR